MMTNQIPIELPQEEVRAEPVILEEAIEAILFAAGHPVTYEKLALTFDTKPSAIKKTVAKYAAAYNRSELPRGVMLLTFDDACQLCTKEQYLSHIRFALGIRKSGSLSGSAVEVLSIVAYHQPVTRAYIDAIRGVDSSYVVSSLLERKLIDVQGRMDAPGRPMLYGTTNDFLRCFGLQSLTELPGVQSEEIQRTLAAIDEQLAQDAPEQLTLDADIAAVTEDSESEAAATETVPEDTAAVIDLVPEADESDEEIVSLTR
ncbi:MAG: SMC-Scp complex subunit ScpB [Eubacteriales bacterium]